MQSVECRWCGSQTTTFPAPPSVPHWPRYDCAGCGTIAYRDVPGEEALAEIYAQGWEVDDSFFTGVTAAKLSKSLLRGLVGHDRPLGKVLDFGAGKGAFAEVLARQDGNEVAALEPYGPKMGIAGVSWFDDQAEAAAHGPFDAIFMIEVIEHLRDPAAAMRQVAEMLTPTGRIYLSTPNSMGLSPRRQGANWISARNPTHINLFSKKSLSICTTRAGLSAFKRNYRPVRFSGSILKDVLIAGTQLVGLDGGLRGSVSRG